MEQHMEVKQTREQLEKRRDELLADLNEVNKDERIELDRDPEEQAIEIAQHEVSVTMEKNLRKELIDIEERLAEMDDED